MTDITKLHWSEGGDAITNFDPHDLPLYQKAVKKYGDIRLYIGDPTPSGFSSDKALRVRGLNGERPNLSDFWKVFNEIRSKA